MGAAALLMLYASTLFPDKPPPKRPSRPPLGDVAARQRGALPQRPGGGVPAAATAAAATAAATPAVAATQKPAAAAAVAASDGAKTTLDGSVEAALKLAVPGGPGGFVLVTFGNAGVKDPLLNFVSYANSAGAAHVVGSVDVTMFDLLAARGTPVYKTPLANEAYSLDGSNQHSSGSWKKFAGMRTGEVAKIVGLGYTVLHTDCDIVYLRDPAPYLMCTPAGKAGEWGAASRWPCDGLLAADVAVSSDNMSPGRDTEGHASYSAGGTFNTGLLLVRPTAAGRKFVTDWHRLVVDPPRGSQFAPLTSDQQVFNHMMRREREWPGISAPNGAHTMKPAWASEIPGFTLGALPLALFLNGHGYFVQRADRRLRVTPIAVHATYSLDNHDGLAKQQRFREAGLWRVDPPSYFEGKFLAYNATPSAALRDALASFKSRGKKPNNIKTHAMALADHLAGLRDALALARALGRTLVLPRWTCYCDRLWSPSDDIFHFGCMYPGAQDGNFLPFDCPMDHVLSPTAWKGKAYRDAAFVDALPPAARAATAEVRVLPRAEYDALPAHAKAAALPLGVSDSDAVARLSPLQNAPVIRLESALGLLCGVDDAAARRELNAEAARLLNVPAWGAKCFQPCKSELKEWLSDDEIARGAQGANFFSLRVPKPPPLDTCVRKS